MGGGKCSALMSERALGQPFVSVIVPVFNGEKHLRQCIESILSQSLRRIEVICIDDGSADASLTILEEYAAADGRLRVISQPNLHAGVARNRGIEEARGKYLVFWDCDDYFDRRALEKMYRQCERDSADICVCGARHFFCDSGLVVHGPMYLVADELPQVIPFNRLTNEDYILEFTTMVVWNKMFRRQFVYDQDLRFDSSRINNDVKFVACALCVAQSITVVKKDLMTYRRNQMTALTNSVGDSALEPAKTWIRTREELLRRDALPQLSFTNRVASSLLYLMRNMSNYEAYNQLASFLRDEGGLEALGLLPSEVRAPLPRRFFESLQEEGPNQALMSLMHEAYVLQLSNPQGVRATLRRALRRVFSGKQQKR